jgi:hypothetical protein
MTEPLVLIRWLDSMAYDRWESKAGMRDRLVNLDGGLEHLTVGWEIDSTDSHIIVAGSRHISEDVWNDAMAIPRVVVLERIELRTPSKKAAL